MVIYQQGTQVPKTEDVKKKEEVVRKIVIDVPGRRQEFHVGLKAEVENDKLNLKLD